MTDIDRAILVLVNIALYPSRDSMTYGSLLGLTGRVFDTASGIGTRGLTRRYRYLRSGNVTSAFGRVSSWGCNNPFGYCFVKRLFSWSTDSLDR